MTYILHISTAVPEFRIEKEDWLRFYSKAVSTDEPERFVQKLSFLNKKMKINSRYSCVSDFTGKGYELFTNGNFNQPIEKRMELYKEKILPLASKAIDKLLSETEIETNAFTHLITVSCTGLTAPGLEFLIAEKYQLQHIEKSAVNFLGCYAAMKALKQAHYIAQSNPEACILIVSAELCSLHFYPSDADEDIISNLLFADGAAAVMVCGDKNKFLKNKPALKIDAIGSAFIPNTADLMTWNITSSVFKMHLSSEVVNAIKTNISGVVNDFLEIGSEPDYWAIHPGGVKIVEGVKESLGLNGANVADSMSVLEQYGNMSSPTILFILKSIFNKIKAAESTENKNIFSCAFGPGLNIEMICLSSVNTNISMELTSAKNHVVEA